MQSNRATVYSIAIALVFLGITGCASLSKGNSETLDQTKVADKVLEVLRESLSEVSCPDSEVRRLIEKLKEQTSPRESLSEPERVIHTIPVPQGYEILHYRPSPTMDYAVNVDYAVTRRGIANEELKAKTDLAKSRLSVEKLIRKLEDCSAIGLLSDDRAGQLWILPEVPYEVEDVSSES